MTITKSYAYAEFEPGAPVQSYDGVRITLAAKLAYERAKRANKWDSEMPITGGIFLAFYAGKAAGKHDLSWDQFCTMAVDAGIVDDATDGDEVEVDLLDPTMLAAPTI